MAIIKRSESESESVTQAQASTAVQERPATPAAPPPQEQANEAPAAGIRSMTEGLPSALEPELRRIIDTAVARVAAIELEAIREARELTQRSEQEAREALRFALDRAFNLINTLELLAATVGGMAEALKIELDDAIDALKSVPEPESALAREIAQGAPAPPEEPAPAAAVEAPPPPEPEPERRPEAVHEPQPMKAPAAEKPEPEPEPEPEAARFEEPPAAVEATEEAPADEAEEAEEAEEASAEQAAAEEAPAPAAQGNGYPPAERQAQSLAEAAGEDSEQEPRRVVIRAPESEDGEPAVPARRRGLVRRLFAK